MVKRAFQNLDVECWRYEQRIGRSPTAVCFFHAAAALFNPITAALDELSAEQPLAQRLLTFQRCRRDNPIEVLRLRLLDSNDDLRVLSIASDGDTVTIVMTHDGLRLVRDGFVAWDRGSEDFGVGAWSKDFKKRDLGRRDLESLEIWFWGPHYDSP